MSGRNKKLLVTGANGMLGGNICSALNETFQVVGLHRNQSVLVTNIDNYSVDIRQEESVRHIIATIRPDLVIHTAGLTDVDLCEKDRELAYSTNVLGTRNIVEGCMEDTIFLYVSTDQVYGHTEDRVESNTSLLQQNEYSRTKYLGEEIVRNQCKNHIIVRTNVFGWNKNLNNISSAEWIYQSLKDRENIILFDDYFISPIYARTFVEVISKLVDQKFVGTVNIGSNVPCSKYMFGRQLAAEFGFEESLIERGSIHKHEFVAERIPNCYLDCQLLSSLGINPPHWRESLRQFHLDKSAA